MTTLPHGRDAQPSPISSVPDASILPQPRDVLDADELAIFERLARKVGDAQDSWRATKRRDDPDSVRLPIGELSQTALAEGFAGQWVGNLAYDRDTGEWLEWDMQGWEVTEHIELHIHFYVDQHLPKMDTPAKQQDINNRWLNQATYRAVADYARNILGRHFDTETNLVGLPRRQVLDTDTAEVRYTFPSECVRRRLPDAVEWTNHPGRDDYDCLDPMAVSRKWTDFIDEMLGSYPPMERVKIAHFLKVWAGAALLGDTRDECAVFLFGKRGSGKTTFSEPLAEVFGSYHVGISGARLTANANHHLQWVAALDGALLATVGELPGRGEWPGHLLNQVISGENVTANRMRQDDKTFRSRAHLLVTGNHRPKADANDGIWRRLAIIQCQQQPATPNKHLKDELKAELPGILNWVLEGAAAYIRNGRELEIPAVVLADTDEYRADADPMERWYLECLAVVDADDFSPADALHANLTDWWQRNVSGDTGRTPGKTRMGNFLTGRGNTSGTKWVNGATQRVRFRVTLCQPDVPSGTQT